MTIPAPLQAEIDLVLERLEKRFGKDAIQYRMDNEDTRDCAMALKIIRQLLEHIEKVEGLLLQRFQDGKRLGVIETEDAMRKQHTALRQAADALSETLRKYASTYPTMKFEGFTAIANYDKLTKPEKSTEDKIKSEILRRESVRDFLENDALENPS